MKHYIKTLLALISLSSKSYLENRWNTAGMVLNATINIFIFIILINVIYMSTDSLNGWSKDQVFLLVGLSRIVLSIFATFFRRSIMHISRYVRKGDLDYILTKPISSQFLISFRYFRLVEVFNILIGIIITIYALQHLGTNINFWTLSLLSISLAGGIAILYGIYYIVSTLSIWIVNFNSLNVVYYIMTNPLALPTNIYGKLFSFIITYVIPLGFIVMIPTQIFMESNYSLLLVELVIAAILILLSFIFWQFALRHYTSASS